MCKTTVKLWHLKNDGRKLFAGTIEAGSPAEFILNWSAFLAASGRGVCLATYEGSFVGLEAAVDSEVGALAAHSTSPRLCKQFGETQTTGSAGTRSSLSWRTSSATTVRCCTTSNAWIVRLQKAWRQSLLATSITAKIPSRPGP